MLIPIHTSAAASSLPQNLGRNPLPQLLQTPSGLALLELQGTINLPDHDDVDSINTAGGGETPIGRLVFPDYVPGEEGGQLMKVYLYVGKHQRLTGEIKKLPRAIAVIRKRTGVESGEGKEELEIVEIVKFKILFSTRPEPVGTWSAED